MNVQTFHIGNTLRFTASFKNWSDQLADPDSVLFRMYDSDYTLLKTVSASKSSTGVFYALWTIPNSSKRSDVYIYEWYATLENTPDVYRGMVKAIFV